jgi:hypothetical protein
MHADLARLMQNGDLTCEETRQLFDSLVRAELSDVDISALLVAQNAKRTSMRRHAAKPCSTPPTRFQSPITALLMSLVRVEPID